MVCAHKSFKVKMRDFDKHSLSTSLLVIILISYLIASDDFTVGFFDILQESNEVPKATLGLNSVWRKYFHLIQWWMGLFFRGQTSANDSVLFKLYFFILR